MVDDRLFAAQSSHVECWDGDGIWSQRGTSGTSYSGPLVKKGSLLYTCMYMYMYKILCT